MLVDPNSIRPSQDFLKPSTISSILENIRAGKMEDLPPKPIIRKDDNGSLIAIDGHNLLAVKCFLKEETEVHIATSADDVLAGASVADEGRNIELKEKYDSCISEQARVEAKGIRSFQDLIALNNKLFEV